MFRHRLIRSLVLHYLEHFGYEGPPLRIFTTPSRVLDELDRHQDKTNADEHGARRDHGWCLQYPRSTIIYVNAAAHEDLGELLDTCCHEALHAARWLEKHGARFEAEVAEAVLG